MSTTSSSSQASPAPGSPAARPILVCVAWPYANSALHLGHLAGCYLPADIFARFQRLRGHDVLMVSGSDEHGTPITVRAEKEGSSPAEVAERYHRINSQALADFDIQFDLFTRTTTDNHRRVVHDIFTQLNEGGYIEPRPTQVLYCPKCERFLPDRFVEGTCPHCGFERARGDQCENCGRTLDPQDLVNPRCRISGDTPIVRESVHLFFRLSAFESPLLEWLRDKSYWRPNVLAFTRSWIEGGLKDRAITRDLSWGVPVPLAGYEEKRIYVWFEAVVGYLSASVEWAARRDRPAAWERFWKDPAARHYYFLGKDNVPFHTIIWPSMLLGVGGLNLPYDVPANEFLQIDGAKFSKSAGLGIWVNDVVDRFEVDAIRYYLTVNMPETRDSNWSWEELVQRVNDELVGTFGNFCHRTLTFARKHFGAIPPLGALQEIDRAALARIGTTGDEVAAALEACEFRRALRAFMSLAQAGNQYFDAKAPWALVKTDREACGTALHVCLKMIAALAVYSAPFVPRSAARLWGFVGGGVAGAEKWTDALAELPAGRELPEPAILFAKLDLETILAGS
jgi:methionyl-tRNA synthetase